MIKPSTLLAQDTEIGTLPNRSLKISFADSLTESSSTFLAFDDLSEEQMHERVPSGTTKVRTVACFFEHLMIRQRKRNYLASDLFFFDSIVHNFDDGNASLDNMTCVIHWCQLNFSGPARTFTDTLAILAIFFFTTWKPIVESMFWCLGAF